MTENLLRADVVIAGAGLAGLVAAHELLDHGKSVLLLDKDVPENLGGLAKESFGGVHLIGTPHQKKSGIADSPELALRDWLSFAQFGEGDSWPRRWAELYCDRSLDLIHAYLDGVGVKFLPVVNWPERGLYAPGNTVPRWHIAWGTGHAIIEQVVRAPATHSRSAGHAIRFRHAVEDVEVAGGRVTGLIGKDLSTGGRFVARGDQVVIATGGICGGDLSKVRANWYAPWGAAPQVPPNGGHARRGHPPPPRKARPLSRRRAPSREAQAERRAVPRPPPLGALAERDGRAHRPRAPRRLDRHALQIGRA